MARSSARLASGTALSLLLSTGILIGTAYAQEAAGEDEAEALGTIVLSAEDQIKQALGVSTVTSEDLAKTPVVNDISEIIRKMPGVNLTGATASGQRGNQRQIDLRGMGPENTLILIDGKPVNSRSAVKMGRNGERDSRGDSNWVPADLIERIEVIRGPAAARYGSGAAGGVVNIITKRPEEMTASVGLHFNSPERGAEGATQRGSFMVAGPAGERLSFRLHGGYARTDADALDINDGAITDAGGTRMLAGREGVVNKDLGALLTWQAAEGHEIDFEASASRQGNIYAGDTQLGSIGTIPAGLWGQETNRMYRRTFALSHRGDYDFGTSNSYVQLENTNNTRLCEGLAGSGEGAITNCVDSDGDGVNDAPGFQTIRTSNISAKTEWMLPLNLRGKETMLTLGAEVRHEKIDDPASITVTLPPTITGPDLENDPSRRDTKLSQTTIGLFAEANIYWNDRLILTPGLRYDHNSGFGSNVSPSLNAEYTFSDEVKLKVGVARAFKAPNVFQLNPNYVYNTRGNGCPWVDGVRLPGPCYVAGNPDLDAEISLNKEIGVAYEGENGLSASVTWFHNDYKNKIYSGQVQQNEDATTNRLFRWENTGPAVIEGIEGNFATAIGEDLMLNTNFTYMIESKIKSTGQPLSLVPDYTINASLDWAVRDDMLLLLSATHYGPIQPSAVSIVTGSVTEDPNERGGYTLWNLGMKWEMNEATQLSAGVSNLFDKQVFRTETSGGSNTFNEPGRAFYIGLNATF